MTNPRVKKARREVSEAKAAELRALYLAHNGIRASDFVEAARDETSAWHAEFEWDDTKAGHEYRLSQARRILRVCIVDVKQHGVTERFIHVPTTEEQREETDDREGTYHPMSVVIENVDWFRRALGELEAKLRAAMVAAKELRDGAEQSGTTDTRQMAQITLAMTALQTASDVVKSLH